MRFAIASLITTKINAQQGFSVSVKAAPQFSFLQNKDDNNVYNYDQRATFNAGFGLGVGYNLQRTSELVQMRFILCKASVIL